jgi:hypothetical protein
VRVLIVGGNLVELSAAAFLGHRTGALLVQPDGVVAVGKRRRALGGND